MVFCLLFFWPPHQGLPHANAWEYLNRQTQFYSNDDTDATQLQQQSPSCASYLFAFFTFCLSNSIIFPGSKETRLVSNTFFFKFPILVDNSLDTTSGFPFWPEIRWFLFVKSFGTVLISNRTISKNHFWQKYEQMIQKSQKAAVLTFLYHILIRLILSVYLLLLIPLRI